MKGEEESKIMEESLIQIQLNKKNKPPSKLKDMGDIFLLPTVDHSHLESINFI